MNNDEPEGIRRVAQLIIILLFERKSAPREPIKTCAKKLFFDLARRKATRRPSSRRMEQTLLCSKSFHRSFIVFAVILSRKAFQQQSKHKQNPHSRIEMSISAVLSKTSCHGMQNRPMDQKFLVKFPEHFPGSLTNCATVSLRFFL